ncbi:uncharacterized protein HMPREF1541_09167 [Cyphellophora europaea CBS 101466]|uniref:Uncharacterized protein n=1 Tax=Cyphellophora europaea (strain CBS 101466) TaxID=1220924 RepID=W2S9D7_CYPE1|nr:uncharacterized protein HMPREF1541_09167 [Cyphellophora europaea CBS 101466]ETN45336.1 hypothetical protein HMPREF1541_09167 [Cyphellophora europaea CBS 101466]
MRVSRVVRGRQSVTESALHVVVACIRAQDVIMATARAGGSATEDLTATSRRLARYETLLNDIMPHVPPNVKQMIEDAREQDVAVSSPGGSEVNEHNDFARAMPSMSNDPSTSSGSTPRVSLPLPVPTTMGGQGPGPHPPPLVRPYENMSPSHSSSAMPRPNSRASPEESSSTRLPSITPHGMLIEPSVEGPPPVLPQIKSETSMLSSAGSRGGNTPPDGAIAHTGWSRQSDHFPVSADGDLRREYASGISVNGIATPAS